MQKTMADQELPPMTGKGKPAIGSVLPDRTTVPRFEKFELTVNLSASYDNPLDPEQIALEAVINRDPMNEEDVLRVEVRT